MHRSRVLVAGSWLASTAVATLVSAAGVSIVTRDVTDDHRDALAAAEVVALLAHPTPPPDAAVAMGDASVVSTADPPAAVDTSAPPDVAVPSPITAPATTSPPSPQVEAGRRTPTDVPSTATFATGGGVLAVTCTAGSATLASARPTDGHRVVVHEEGPTRVVVEFAGKTGDVLAAGCRDGAPVLLDDASRLVPSAMPSVPAPSAHDPSTATEATEPAKHERAVRHHRDDERADPPRRTRDAATDDDRDGRRHERHRDRDRDRDDDHGRRGKHAKGDGDTSRRGGGRGGGRDR